MEWNDPIQRSQLAEMLGPAGYAEAFAKHLRETRVTTVNGLAIRLVDTRFGRLYQVDATRRAHPDLEEAKKIARETTAHD